MAEAPRPRRGSSTWSHQARSKPATAQDADRKPSAEDHHVTEVREAQNGLSNQINRLKRQLSDSRLAPEDRPAIEAELSEASGLLDYSEQWVPRG